MTGTTPVTTANTYRGVNRVVSVFTGTDNANAGAITGTRESGGQNIFEMPVGDSVTQQAIFWVARGWYLHANYLFLNGVKTGGGQQPEVTVKGFTYSYVTGTKYEVFRFVLDTSVSNTLDFEVNTPFPIDGRSVLWFEAETTQNNTEVRCRFGGLYTHS